MNEDNIAIKVENVTKTFKLPHEKQTSIKSALISRLKGGRSSYERQQVLNDISFEVEKGDFFAIVGRNGSGKSTLLKLLAGIYTPSSGSITVNGKLTPFIELGVGFNPELTGRENVFLNGALLGFNRPEMEAMYENIVEFAELERFMDQKLKNYSSGMQVRLAFSIAIRANSDILLLDEVLAVGDAAFQQKCFDYFEELKSTGQTVVFVSHDMGAVTRFCTKAIYIKDGDLIFEGTPMEVADIYREENIDTKTDESTEESEETENKVIKGFSIKTKVVKQTKEFIEFEIDYKAEADDDMYVGISILKDGFSIAEIITPKTRPLRTSGLVNYTLNTTNLNAASYMFTAALFKSKNRQLLAFQRKGSPFVVKGVDPTRGAAIKLDDAWRFSEES